MDADVGPMEDGTRMVEPVWSSTSLALGSGKALKSDLRFLTARSYDVVIQRFRDIVGSIIVLADYLSINSLASLLRKDPDDVRLQLDSLHSVLNVSTDLDRPFLGITRRRD